MKVYIVQSVENKEGEDVFGYIYPNNSNMAVFKSYEHAVEFVKKMMVNHWEVKYRDILFEKDDKDPGLVYAIEQANKSTIGDLFWACIIERELQD